MILSGSGKPNRMETVVNDYFYKWENEEEAEFIFKIVENAGVDYVH
ncbi:hypothetical protein ACR1PN_06685 [Chryseobacterium sp. RLHN22]